ncbi:MAG TPA: polyribonucleotide nucleotidyltransferase [Candidatus Paceibacterota bacterium]
MNLERKQFSTDFAGKPLTFEISKLAEQANASVVARYDGTEVLATVVMSAEDKKADYFPLVVDYEERFYAAGKIIGSRFVRREGRPSEEAILSGRIIDRTIRPLFDHRMRREVQVVITILAIDERNDPDFLALAAASTAIAISEIPWDGPVAGVKIMKKIGSQGFIMNPDNAAIQSEAELVAFAAGTEKNINMIELEGFEASEENAVKAFAFAHDEIKKLVSWQKQIIKEIGRKKAVILLKEPHPEIKTKIKDFLGNKLEAAVYVKGKKDRENKLSELQNSLKEFLKSEEVAEDVISAAEHFLEEEIDALVHKNILEKNLRPDGRKLDEIRELYAEVGTLKRAHGSAIFIRGNTQALAVTTLGPPNAEQLIESIEFSGKRRFLLHYNFPPYSVGEIGSFRGPGRREIGHGALAGKAVKNLIPSQEEFPYTIRVVSEILSSNGSSSMATVCATSLSLMDAGVPIKKPIAGIAMGLIVDQRPATNDKRQNYKILTDIQGPEDHYGDMDFKAAGTLDGLTAIQMDVKINGVTPEMISEILAQAKKARLEILHVMNKVLPKHRDNLSPYAPVILTLDIPASKIGEVIGPGGKIINSIIAETGAASIDIEQTGKVFITGADLNKAKAAYEAVKSIVKTYEIGEIVEGEVVKILDFGAIVQIGPRQDGMIHVSELKNGFVKNVNEVVKVGDKVRAKIIRADQDGRIGLSLKNLN